MRRRLAVTARLCVVLAFPASAAGLLFPEPAPASTLSRFALVTDRWTFTAGGESNIVSIGESGSRFVITDPADEIVLGSVIPPCILNPTCGCTGLGTNTVSCVKGDGMTVLAGDGSDRVTVTMASSYPVSLRGEAGSDELTGGLAADLIDGGPGNDPVLAGAGGNDTVQGGTGRDGVFLLQPVGRTAEISGGPGIDTFSFDDADRTGGVTATLGGGNSDNDVFGAGAGFEALAGSDFADTLTGTGAADTLSGGSGPDTLVGGAGADALLGGDGRDKASYADGRTTTVVAALAGVNTDGDTFQSIADLIGGPGNDTLTGDDAANALAGEAGDDVLIGGPGADGLDGGSGRNTASYQDRDVGVSASLAAGGSPSDGDTYTAIQQLRGGAGDDTLVGDGGENVLQGGIGDDVLIGAGEDDDLIGGAGRNTASYEERATPVTASLAPGGAKPDSDVYEQIQSLRGGGGADTLTGDDGPNIVSGGAGADTVTGLGGFDELRAGPGADTIAAIDGAPDAVDCGADDDRADLDGVDAHAGCEAVRRADFDRDGHDGSVDCNDIDPAINPSAPETLDNSVDENCDGILGATVVPDRDADGFAANVDCNDADRAIRPGAIEVPGNRIDENCDGIRPDFPLINASIVVFVRFSAEGTRVSQLAVSNIPARGRVELRCRPPSEKRAACPFRSIKRTIAKPRRKLDLTGRFKRRRLPPGTVLDIRALAPNTIGKVRIERIRRGRTSRTLLCLRPGAKRPTACPR